MHKRRLIWAAAVLILAAAVLPGLDTRLTVTRYEVRSPKITAPARLALVTDVHACAQPELLNALRAEKPDLVLLGGDIFDDTLPYGAAEEVLAEIAAEFPAYYVTGNHEFQGDNGTAEEKTALAEACGAVYLRDEARTLTCNGGSFTLCGIDDAARVPDDTAEADFRARLAQLSGQAGGDGFTVLLSHRPLFFEDYAAGGFDLVLCGHNHGGQWRIPGLVNGLYCPDEGLFPKYAGGRYEKDGTVMLVSRGLAGLRAVHVPRLYNPRELVIADLLPAGEQ